MRTRTLFRYGLLALASAAVACTVHQQTTPSLTGPSTLATSVSVTAIPDSISQDGGSQASVRVMTYGPNGQPLAGQTIRLDVQVNGVEVDFGTLSARTIVTGSDGTAFAVYTAPPPLPSGASAGTCRTFNTPGTLAGQCVDIAATPTGSNFAASQTQSVEIRLVPTGVIVPPGQTPVPSFSFSPTSPQLNATTVFDGSASCAGPLVNGACNPTVSSPTTITQYAWTFGDGANASGKTVSHAYASVGVFNATLTVTNSGGLSASTTLPVTVSASSAPTAAYVFSPTTPNVNDVVNFDASGSQAAPGHSLVQFSWNFGDGGTGAGFQAQHKFTAAGTYAVLLTVLDDSGQRQSSSQTVAVGTGNPVPVITFSPTTPVHGGAVNFNSIGSTTSGGATISTYAWDFGDSGTSVLQSPGHIFAVAGTYIVRLTITDSQGRVGTVTVSVTVS